MTTVQNHLEGVTGATFAERVLGAAGPVLVEFTAAWCPPCRALAPVLADLAREQAGRLAIVALDVDRDPEVAARYGVMSFPTLILFRDGQPVQQLIGARPKAALLRALAPSLA